MTGTYLVLLPAIAAAACDGLMIQTDPPMARVLLDGRDAGASPACLKKGMLHHSYSAVLPGYVVHSIETRDRVVTIRLRQGAGGAPAALGPGMPSPTQTSPLPPVGDDR